MKTKSSTALSLLILAAGVAVAGCANESEDSLRSESNLTNNASDPADRELSDVLGTWESEDGDGSTRYSFTDVPYEGGYRYFYEEHEHQFQGTYRMPRPGEIVVFNQHHESRFLITRSESFDSDTIRLILDGEHGQVKLRAERSPWECAASAHQGKQLWTCEGRTLNKCAYGRGVRLTPPFGCVTRETGKDDLGIYVTSYPAWDCAKSSVGPVDPSYANQVFTCSGGDLWRCTSEGLPPNIYSMSAVQRVACPNGCKSNDYGVADECE